MPDALVDNKPLHRVLRKIASYAVVSFFSRVHVIGEENVPKEGPMIVTATHHNMMLDPAVLSSAFPYGRVMNYWSKASLFANPVLKYVLLSTGNIPVERKSKDRQILFRGTFDALAQGWAVALFPEGTSYTEPKIMQIKDGASWAALEYAKWAQENPSKVGPVAKDKDLVIVPAAIVYTNKPKYRSDVIMEFANPIKVNDFLPEFISGGEGAARLAVKKLTSAIYTSLVQNTVNAPDWETLYAARMARDMLWPEERSIPLDDFVTISQTLVDLFSTPDATNNLVSVRRNLLEYYSLLHSTHLTHSTLSTLPLPSTLNPRSTVPLSSRLYTLLTLLSSSFISILHLPFFIVPLIVHAPVYAMARYGAKLVEDEEETQAQNKVVFGLLFVMLIYPAAFVFLWAMLWYSPIGAIVSAGILYLFGMYHNRMINDNYEHAKRLLTTWRVLVGIWVPRKWDLSISALSQYTSPLTPPENPWIDRNREPKASVPSPAASPAPGSASASPAPSSGTAKGGNEDKGRRRRRPPTRRLIRHVLRARAQATHALASFFAQLERREDGWVHAAPHLARIYNGRVENLPPPPGLPDDALRLPMPDGPTEIGYRRAKEVVAFLRKKGAKVQGLESGIQGDWAAAVSSGTETPVEEKTEDEVTWVPASRS
ncbi:acyltransferase [Punctularia strigosozonata HHB-11173 SS5]|uniref:acyltransferase n=1 Tax=Punctularia strigosozonata (strain HHB-11173) TaxID=741275 RepID=UPI0004417634|nr:acyltransferase [Punctularia strigosozonata HHB-11173 SS5]EIN11226.1 acyltransferase [Punctularia strigosozonata HHB-11173 SS5]